MPKAPWHAPKKPSEIVARPWLSDDAVAYFESILTPDMSVIEFGGGGSTLWLAERVKTVTTHENNIEWQNAILNSDKCPNDNIFMKSGEPELGFRYDLLFIDGEPVEERGLWLLIAPDLVRPGGWVVLDNANRPEYKLQRAKFAKHADLMFTSKQQAAHLVTEFWRVHDT